jgi:hypothetical protein
MTEANEDQATPPVPLKPIARRSETVRNLPDAREAECESIYAAKRNNMTEAEQAKSAAFLFLMIIFFVLGVLGGAGYGLTGKGPWPVTVGYTLIGGVIGFVCFFFLVLLGVIHG